MTLLLVTVLFSIVFAILATQNTVSVPVNFMNYTWSTVPLYMVILGSLLGGLLLSWMVSLVDGIANALSLSSKDHKIHQTEQTVGSLETRLKELEIENAKLKGEHIREEIVTQETNHRPRRNILDRVRHTFST